MYFHFFSGLSAIEETGNILASAENIYTKGIIHAYNLPMNSCDIHNIPWFDKYTWKFQSSTYPRSPSIHVDRQVQPNACYVVAETSLCFDEQGHF